MTTAQKLLTRRLILSGLGSGLAGAALADAPLRSLRPRARRDDPEAAVEDLVPLRPRERPDDLRTAEIPSAAEIVREAGLGGAVGCVVADARTGQILEAVRPLTAQPPASVAKAVTAVFALDRLGPEHRFATRLIATGPVTDGVLDGDLVLAGGGDPVLVTDHLAAMAEELKAAGLREVRGAFRLWGGALPYVPSIDPGQPDQVGYSPSIGGLNLNFNRVRFEWRRQGGAYEVTMDARSERLRPAVTVAQMRVVDRALPVYTYEPGEGVDRWSVARRALGNGGSRWLPVRVPTHYAGDVFRSLARSQGMSLPVGSVAEELPEGEELVVHRSAPMRDIVRGMLRYSTNLTAEAMGLSASGARAGLGASAAEMNGWARDRLGIQAAFVDHSGLGDASRITALDMVRGLVRLGPGPALQPLLKNIPLLTDDGETLPNPPVIVRAKTGTLNFVSGLAGYARTLTGRDLAFAIFAADVDRRARIDRANREAPEGARGWNGRAKRMQQRLLQRWGRVFAEV